MLNGLTDEYEPLIQTICNGTEELTLEAVTGRVIAHEKRLLNKEKKSVVFHTNANRDKRSAHRSTTTPYTRTQSTPHSRPHSTPHSRTRPTPHVSVTCWHCQKIGHTSSVCKSRLAGRPPVAAATVSEYPLARLFLTTTVSGTHSWLLDSGATNHMASDRCLFTSYQPYIATKSVYLADNSTAPIVEQETVQSSVQGLTFT